MSDPDEPADTTGAATPRRQDGGIDEPAAVDGCGGFGDDVDAAVDAVPSDDSIEEPDPRGGWGGWGTDASI